mgnify:CR=1 FL=1|jgi:hypothetical protein
MTKLEDATAVKELHGDAAPAVGDGPAQSAMDQLFPGQKSATIRLPVGALELLINKMGAAPYNGLQESNAATAVVQEIMSQANSETQAGAPH